MKNLVVINCKTNEVNVFNGGKKLAQVTFNTFLDTDQVEAMRVDPKAFLESVGMIEKSEDQVKDLNPVSI